MMRAIIRSSPRPLFVLVSALFAFALYTTAAPSAQAADAELFRLEARISLGPVRGRIDHMAIDLVRQRLFIAELGNDSVGVVDLQQRKTIRTIDGLAEPQGVGYVPSTDTIYVANARDGSVRLFRGTDYAAIGRIDLGSDADNIRFDAAANRILVGYGGGAIAAIDVTQQKKFGDAKLPAHPESFQIGGEPKQIFVNVPDAREIVVLDGITGGQNAKWPVRQGGNFPMAVDQSTRRVFIISRTPAKLDVFAENDGSLIAERDTCGDSDDLFVDPKLDRIYVSCGAGFIDVFDTNGSAYTRAARIPTASGARTSLFVPELDVLLLGVRAAAAEAAAVWVFKPVP